jgi:hypothetical protein
MIKSDLCADDCVEAFLMTLDDRLWQNPKACNVASEDRRNAPRIGRIVAGAMGADNVFVWKTSKPGERSWPAMSRPSNSTLQESKGMNEGSTAR